MLSYNNVPQLTTTFKVLVDNNVPTNNNNVLAEYSNVLAEYNNAFNYEIT